jgi:3-methyl-2-oxobutanoate hydroxymethyltransferase
VLEDALALQAAGCFAIVFEAIPAEVTDAIMPHLDIVVIGIGAGASTDGQVLVLHDLLTIHDDFKPKFAKRFGAVKAEMLRGVQAYAEEVRTRRFPGPEHTYGIAPEELERFRAEISAERPHSRR